MSYSQHDEERVIVDYFNGRIGTFLDVGAYCAKFSNTLALAESYWPGLAIEPDPHAFCQLLEDYALHKIQGVSLLHAFIGIESGITKFYGSGGDGVSTANESHRAKWSLSVDYRKFFVPVITIPQVLEKFGAHYDFVSLDVEGVNLAVLQQMPLDEMETSLICVEHESRDQEVWDYCAAHGLDRCLLRNGENMILGK